MDSLCPTCGAPVPDRDNMELIYSVSDVDYDAIVGLLTGRLDRATCQAGCKLDYRLPIAFSDTANGRFLLVAGDNGRSPAAGREVPVGYVSVNIPDTAALRAEVTAMLRTRIATLVPAVPADDNWIQAGTSTWSNFTEASVTALAVALRGAVEELHIGRFAVDGGPTLTLQAFGQAQAWAWFLMCAAWRPLEAGDTFETDLERFIDLPPIVGPAAAYFCQILDSFKEPGEERPVDDNLFRLQAVRASLHQRLGTTNGQAVLWAAVWLIIQVWQREQRRVVPGLHVSLARARATIARGSACNVVAAAMQGLWPDGLYADDNDERRMQRRLAQQEVLTAVLEELYPGAVQELMLKHLRVGGKAGEDLNELVERIEMRLREDWDAISKQDAVTELDLARQAAVPLVRAGRVDDVRRIAAAMTVVSRRVAWWGPLSVVTWLAEQLIAMDYPADALAVVGSHPLQSEGLAPTDLRLMLQLVRATALRDLGRPTEALAALNLDEPSVEHLHDESLAVNLVVLGARLLCGTGQVFQALEVIELATERWGDRYPIVHETAAATVARIGRYGRAAFHCRQAFELTSHDPTSYPKARYAALTMRSDLWAGNPSDPRLLAAVAEIPLDQDPTTHLIAAATLLERSLHGTDGIAMSGPELEFLHATSAALPALTDSASRSRGVLLTGFAYLVRGLYLRRFEPDRELAAWLDLSGLDGHPLDSAPYFLDCLIRHGAWPRARQMLPPLLDTLTRAMGDDAETSAAPFGGGRFLGAIDQLTATVLSSVDATVSDLRTIGELRRETFGRRLSGHATEQTADWRRNGFDDEVIRGIRPVSGSVGVLEWITDGSRTRCLLTYVDAGGNTHDVVLDPPGVNMAELSERLAYRLSSWRPSRPGDPLDLPAWTVCAEWLAGVVREHLAAGDHMVFLPHSAAPHLPWHSAVGESITCSYEPGWVSLLRTTAEPPSRKHGPEGVVVVPRLGDPAPVVDAMRAFVDGVGEEPLVLSGPRADRSAVQALLTSTDTLTVLTHGYASQAEGDVALMLAAHGRLPLSHSIAAGSAVGREHRYGWRDYAALTKAPAVLFSAACSSGASFEIGAGDRIGLYSLLRHAGLRSVIAPRWEIVAADVLPILASVRHHVVRDGLGPGEALRRSVSVALAHGIPRWSAHALALEGDWR